MYHGMAEIYKNFAYPRLQVTSYLCHPKTSKGNGLQKL